MNMAVANEFGDALKYKEGGDSCKVTSVLLH